MSIAWAGWLDDATAKISGREFLITYGPSLGVDVGYDEKFDYATKANVGLNVPESAAKNILALVDTGATESCIDETLAESLNLTVVDRIDIAGVGGTHKANLYLAHIDIPAIALTDWGRFAGVKLAEGGQHHRVIIGRTLLSMVIMIYDGRDGSVKIAR
jgi:predicted aspartyl protease